jgi:hypothetical protein
MTCSTRVLLVSSSTWIPSLRYHVHFRLEALINPQLSNELADELRQAADAGKGNGYCRDPIALHTLLTRAQVGQILML